ncbi:MAG: hypothetical protein AMXMBFR33_19320 [Candidatus Xenobia bacterium]|jgi:hypothetical protein
MELKTLDLETFAEHLRARVAQGRPTSAEPESVETRLEQHGQSFHLGFVPEGKLLIVARARPRHKLLVCAESHLTQHLDQLGISGEIKLGRPEFDQRYVLKNATVEEARATLDDEFVDTLRGLEPWMEFEMTAREYRLLKVVDAEYSAERLNSDLKRMAKLVAVSCLPPEEDE